jgi:hypothetical protein
LGKEIRLRKARGSAPVIVCSSRPTAGVVDDGRGARGLCWDGALRRQGPRVQRKDKLVPYWAPTVCRTQVVYRRQHHHNQLQHMQLEALEEVVELVN